MAASFSAHAEFFIFAAVCLAAFGIQGFWLRRAKSARVPWAVWTIAAVLLAVTWHVAGQAGNHERQRIQRFTQDFARLYGSEMEKRGHSRLGSDAEANDPLYLDLIETEKRWLGLSPSVNDIYTFRKLPDGRNVFIVDSETDYDGNGKYEGEREQRTEVGEVYDVEDAALEQAFRGEPAFAFEPITDRWGTWVSAFVSLHAPDGSMEGVLGVDFEAKTFTQSIAAAQWRVIGLMAVVQLVLLAASTLTSMMRAEAAERRRAGEALRKNEAQLHTIVENLAEGVAVSDLDGQLLHFNRAALAMHGFGSLEETRRHLTEFAGMFEMAEMNGAALALEQWPLPRILRGENLRDMDVRVRRPDAGWERVFSYGGCLVHDTTGKPLMAVVTVNDITERKRSEAALEKAHRELIDISRQAGMAEVATSVLHNVGNVLNSVNVSATIVAEKIRKSERASLAKVVALLREHEADLGTFLGTDSKGKQVVGFLDTLAKHLATEQAATVEELKILQKNIGHIKDVVAMQQSYAKVSGVNETLSVVALIEDTLHMNAESLARHDVEVVREFADVPDVTVDKHKLLQILVNLVRNAKHSCDDAGRSDKRLTLRVANGNGRVKISVSDNGLGIPPENLTRIFNHGFTTKKEGHGFGLHSGALAAREMGGALSVHSEGMGHGATFTVDLPLQPLNKSEN